MKIIYGEQTIDLYEESKKGKDDAYEGISN